MTSLQSIFKVVIFALIMILVADIGGGMYAKQYYKGGLDFCTKSASMKIVRDDDYARGIVKIDREKSKEEFKIMMKKQFELSDEEVETGIIYAEPVNTFPSKILHPVSGKEYLITEPIFIAVFEIKRKGIFIKNKIIVDNISGSRVRLYSN